jgi:DNA-binding transcriptional ArsR family regulator
MHDIIIRGGTVVDGTGAAAHRADIAIDEGRISAIGEELGEFREVLEASGLIASRKVGRVRTCELEPQKLAAVERWFGEQRAIWESRYQNLEILLAKVNEERDED